MPLGVLEDCKGSGLLSLRERGAEKWSSFSEHSGIRDETRVWVWSRKMLEIGPLPLAFIAGPRVHLSFAGFCP